MNKKISNASTLYISKGSALFIGSVIDTNLHRHHAIQIIFGIDNLFSINVGGKDFLSRSIMINPNIEHRLIGKDGIQALLLIEPESFYGKTIKNRIMDEYSLLDFDDTFYKILKGLMLPDKLTIRKLIELIFHYWDIPVIPAKIEDRIKKTIGIIESSNDKKITIKKLADHVSLSESRLQHIFKSQIGISIKRYLLWKRMIDGINAIINGNDFTFAAHESGFSDSSHMSRTFKEMFGVNLSEIFKNSRSVQVINEDN